MMRRMMTTVAAASMLLVALFGGTALAQDAVVIDGDGVSQPNPEGYTDVQCAVAIAAYYEDAYPDFSADNFEGLDDAALTAAVAGWLAENDQTFADICAIYAALPEPPDVLEVVIVDPEPEPAPTVVEPEVLGVTIAKTGADTLILGIIGAVLMGLGVLAVRRTRIEHGVR